MFFVVELEKVQRVDILKIRGQIIPMVFPHVLDGLTPGCSVEYKFRARIILPSAKIVRMSWSLNGFEMIGNNDRDNVFLTFEQELTPFKIEYLL